MKPQARHEVLRAVLPALAGAVLTAVLWFAADWAHESYFPAFPLVGQMRIGEVPGRFWEYEGPWSVGANWHLFLTWAMACAFFAAGPLVAFLFSRGKAAYIFSTALLLGVITHGCINVMSLFDANILRDWRYGPATLGDNLRWAWPCLAWILGLSLGGAGVGIAAQKIARAVARRAERRKMPARK
jgi:hypothetical protein